MSERRIVVGSPVGRLCIVERRGRIVSLDFARGPMEAGPPATPLLRRAATQLAAYFAGKRKSFGLPLAPEGTAFQKRVWRRMRTIPFGQTRTYGEIARALRSAPRAVGAACRTNPLPIFIPCHRVVAANGRLGGYSGGKGLAVKRRLLRLEGALA